ncbi:MAG: polysaccharide pyruvyl transferase family protein [bacterium]
MKGRRPLFILAGNGPYDNRGCEAIVRGTAEILRLHFDNPQFIAVSNYLASLQFEEQQQAETDKAIIHEKIVKARKRFEPVWFLETFLRFLYPTGRCYFRYQKMLPYLKTAVAVLSVGGDNYSLDYGIPKLFTELDDLVLAKRKPIIIWGASVGPFDKIPGYERYMVKHLKKVTAIFARESATVDYLAEQGITKNVYRVADPAFLLKPGKPPQEKFNRDIPKEAIGINLSPLMAKYVTNGSIREWVDRAAKIVKHISEKTKRPLFLIYHVTSVHSNDYGFLQDVLAALGNKNDLVQLMPPGLRAAELKWLIGKMSVFAGARTHATIAAISSSVPTLSFSYSLKAKGINRDIFGHENFCLEAHRLRPEIISEKIEEVIQNSEEIKKKINSVLPEVIDLALNAGKYLQGILNNNEA